MRKRFVTSLLAVCLLVGPISGCSFTTTGEANWEVYGGVRTRQLSEEPASVEIKSSVVDKVVDSLTDGEVTEAE